MNESTQKDFENRVRSLWYLLGVDEVRGSLEDDTFGIVVSEFDYCYYESEVITSSSDLSRSFAY